MRILLLAFVLLGSTAAQAQPGQTEPVAYYVEPAAQLQLSEEQHDLLARGEISIGKYVTGGVLSYALGFGIGHAVQGRWAEKGWIFTAGETASIVALIYGLSQLDHYHDDYYDDSRYVDERQGRRGQNYMLAGVVGLVGFRVWEVVDAWVAPPRHNRRVRALKQQLGLAPPTYGFYLAPPQSSNASGGVAGLSMSF